MSSPRSGFVIVALGLGLLSCSGDSEKPVEEMVEEPTLLECGKTFDAGGGWDVCNDEIFHRVEAGMCPMALPSRSIRNDGIGQLAEGTCTQDRHCTEKTFGYCLNNQCAYRCQQDSHCSTGEICFCPESSCIVAGCSVDSDCAENEFCEATQTNPTLPYSAACSAKPAPTVVP